MNRVEQFRIEAELGLDEAGAGLDLQFEIGDALAIGRHEGIGGGAEEEIGRDVELAAGGEGRALDHVAGDAQQRDRVEVEHGLGLRLVALADIVAGQAQHVAHAERRHAEQVALHGDAVAVAAGHLADRRQPVHGQHRGRRRARHVAIAAGAVGDVDGIGEILEAARPLDQPRGLAESGGATSTVTTKRPERQARSKR